MRFFLILLFLFEVNSLIAQTISGTIRDSSGESIIGANVSIKGSERGIISDIDGKFILEANPEDALVISYIGFSTQEILVGNRTQIDITLQQGKTLEEVVITGFGEVKKRLYTGKAQSMSMDEVRQGGLADASQMLQGKAAGVSVQSVSGTFGAGPRITIRGSSSINGDGKPLWVIDGVVQEDLIDISANDLVSGDPTTLISSGIAGLNPNDIKSFEILKDASATAIYGSRSLNGVIVITTKKGKKNAPMRINYSAEFVTRSIPSYLGKNIMNSKENMSLLSEMDRKGLLDLTTLSQEKNSGIYGILSNKIRLKIYSN